MWPVFLLSLVYLAVVLPVTSAHSISNTHQPRADISGNVSGRLQRRMQSPGGKGQGSSGRKSTSDEKKNLPPTPPSGKPTKERPLTIHASPGGRLSGGQGLQRSSDRLQGLGDSPRDRRSPSPDTPPPSNAPLSAAVPPHSSAIKPPATELGNRLRSYVRQQRGPTGLLTTAPFGSPRSTTASAGILRPQSPQIGNTARPANIRTQTPGERFREGQARAVSPEIKPDLSEPAAKPKSSKSKSSTNPVPPDSPNTIYQTEREMRWLAKGKWSASHADRPFKGHPNGMTGKYVYGFEDKSPSPPRSRPESPDYDYFGALDRSLKFDSPERRGGRDRERDRARDDDWERRKNSMSGGWGF